MILRRIETGLLSKLQINMKDKIFDLIKQCCTTPCMYIGRIDKPVTNKRSKIVPLLKMRRDYEFGKPSSDSCD